MTSIHYFKSEEDIFLSRPIVFCFMSNSPFAESGQLCGQQGGRLGVGAVQRRPVHLPGGREHPMGGRRKRGLRLLV